MTSTKRVTDYGGLHREKQMWEIIHYLTYNQEKQQFPDREAKQIREHPYMTQLDFFDMQEDQKRAWEGHKREQEAKTVSQETQTSVAELQAVAGASTTGNVPTTTQFHFPGSGPDEEMEADREEEAQVNIHSFLNWGNIRRRAESSLSENSGTVPSIFAAASASVKSEPHDEDMKTEMKSEMKGEHMSDIASASDRSRSDKAFKKEEPVIKKEEIKSEGGEMKGIFGSTPAHERRLVFGGGTPFTTVAPRLNNPAGSVYPQSLPPPPPPLPKPVPSRASSSSAAAAAPSGAQARAARKERDSGIAEVTGDSANRNQDINYWADQSPNDLRAQLNLRHPNRVRGQMTEWAFAKKAQLLEIIKRMIDNGTW